MIKVRNGCFETNSSSVHTLVISRNMPEVLPPSIGFHIKEYGWEIEAYDDIQDRADYFYTAACSICGYDVRKEVEEKLKPYGVEVKFSYYDRPSFSIYEKGGAAYLNNGGIDHTEDLQEFVDRCMNDTNYLVRWLFGDTSRFYTGNDNCDYEDLFDPHVDKKNEEEYYKGN